MPPSHKHVMQSLRKKWGSSRRTLPDMQAQRNVFLELNFTPFFALPDTGHGPETISMDQFEDFRQQLKAIHREKWSPLQEWDKEAEASHHQKEPLDSDNHHARRMQLLGEIASEQFRSGMLSWLTSVTPENDFSSSSLEELEEIERQTRYRMKVIGVLQSAMQQELDAIEREVRGKRLRQNEEVTTEGAGL